MPLPSDTATGVPTRVIDRSNRALAGFTSPTGHLVCLFTSDVKDGASAPGHVTCETNEKAWTPPPKPRNCHLDWAYGIDLDARAGFYCGSDTVRGDKAAGTDGSVVLAYGTAMRFRQLTCTSEETGVDCVNAKTKAGFVLGRYRYQIRNP